MDRFTDNMIIQTFNDMLPKKVTEKLHKAFHFYDFRNKELSEIGIKLTLTYFISIPIIIFILDATKPKELSGYGDFLAGFFSPIAFGWLVIGYLMQNKELKNSVKQTGESQRLARDQLEFQKLIREKDEKNKMIESQPIFDIERVVRNNESLAFYTEPLIKVKVEKNDAFNVFFTRKDTLVKTLTHNENHMKVGKAKVNFHLQGVDYKKILGSIEPCTKGSFNEKLFLDIYINYTDKVGTKRKIKAKLIARCDAGEPKLFLEYKHFEWV